MTREEEIQELIYDNEKLLMANIYIKFTIEALEKLLVENNIDIPDSIASEIRSRFEEVYGKHDNRKDN